MNIHPSDLRPSGCIWINTSVLGIYLLLSFFFHFCSLVILSVSLFFSCFRYFYVFINFIDGTFKIIVKRYWIALEIALYKFIIIIIIIIASNDPQ